MNFGTKTSFVVALALFAIVVYYSAHCFGQNWNNRVCAVVGGGGSTIPSCHLTGNQVCATRQSQGVYGPGCSGSCEWCASDSIIPNTVCVELEGNRCYLSGDAAKFCSSAALYKSECEQTSVGGPCACAQGTGVNPTPLNCDGKPYFPCDPSGYGR